MKNRCFVTPSGWLLSVALLAGPVWAGPLHRDQVAAEAKWVLHVDLDNFRSTRVGECVVKGRIEPNMEKAKADLKTYLDFDFEWTEISSFTAYGMDFEARKRPEGVLLIQTAMDVQKALESAIAKQTDAGVAGNVRKVEESPVPIYSVRKEFFVALPADKPVVVARTQDLVQKALAVVSGRSPNLAGTQAFLDFPQTPKAFAFLAMAAGFAENAPIPPQAQILKMTEAGRIVLGESGTQVFLNATLKTKSAEASAQMQQIIQGLLALGALSQSNNQDLMQLLQATKVAANDRMVTIGVELPVVTVVQKIQERQKSN